MESEQIQVLLEVSKEPKACQENFGGVEATLETRKAERMELEKNKLRGRVLLRKLK